MANNSRGNSGSVNNKQGVSVNPQPATPIPVTPAILEQFLTNQGEQIEVQRKEQEIQLKEQDIRLREIDSTNAYSLRALDAQLIDRENARRHEHSMKQTRYRYWLFAGSTVAVLSCAGLAGCIAYGQSALALDIVKTVVPPIITAAGGYFVGKSKNKPIQEVTEATEVKS